SAHNFASDTGRLPSHWSTLDSIRLEFDVSQSQSVYDDRHGTEAHRGTCDNRAQQQAEKGVEQPGSQGNPQRIVDEGEEQVLPDVSHHGAAQPDGFDNAAQISFHQGDAGALHGHVSAVTHRDADVGGCQCGGIIDAVTSHGHDVALFSEQLDTLVFVLWFN